MQLIRSFGDGAGPLPFPSELAGIGKDEHVAAEAGTELLTSCPNPWTPTPRAPKIRGHEGWAGERRMGRKKEEEDGRREE